MRSCSATSLPAENCMTLEVARLLLDIAKTRGTISKFTALSQKLCHFDKDSMSNGDSLAWPSRLP